MALKPVKVGVVGSGNISYTYLKTLSSGFSIIDLVGCSDLIPERSKARSELFGIRQMTTEEILKDPEIELVVNITQMADHTEVTKMILEAGKHCYSEKSAGCNFQETKANVELAASKGLRFGAAPDTFLGAAYQTARKLIDDGWIGDPIIARAWCIRGYHFQRRPAHLDQNANFVKYGTTVTYDNGGYFTYALISLLGPVARCAGFARPYENLTWENTKHPDFGKKVKYGTGATLLMGVLEFEGGCYGNLVLTHNSFGKEIPIVEIIGTKGLLSIPDPNIYGGWGHDIYLTRVGDDIPERIPFTHGFADTDPSILPLTGKREPGYTGWRGIAVVDMAYAIRRNRPQRCSPELALHNVEILSSIEENSQKNPGVYTMTTRPQRPAPLAPGYIGPVEVMEGSIDNIR